jgi:hypothetical protein
MGVIVGTRIKQGNDTEAPTDPEKLYPPDDIVRSHWYA